jgi:ubiquinone/menaquinone biosynthesis C-methylase UbiE
MDSAHDRSSPAEGGEFVNGSPTIAPAIDPGVSGSAPAPSLVSVEEGYARWAATYDRTPNPLLALEERCLLPLLPKIAGKRVLDLACGTGRWLEKLSAAAPELAIGVDQSAAMLGVARVKSAIRERLARAECLHLPFKDSAFDLAICSFALEHMGNLRRLATEWSRVLQPHADFYVTELHPTAYAAGWRTGFRDPQGSMQIETTAHSVEEVATVFNSAGFELTQAMECFIGEPERPIFASAGKERFFDTARAVPAIVILHFRRDSSAAKIKL